MEQEQRRRVGSEVERREGGRRLGTTKGVVCLLVYGRFKQRRWGPDTWARTASPHPGIPPGNVLGYRLVRVRPNGNMLATS